MIHCKILVHKKYNRKKLKKIVFPRTVRKIEALVRY